MKLCINCKHNEREMWCIAPINGVSPVDGRVNPSFASVARGATYLSNGCGIDAVHFEQKPQKLSHYAVMPKDVTPPPEYSYSKSQSLFATIRQYLGKRK